MAGHFLTQGKEARWLPLVFWGTLLPAKRMRQGFSFFSFAPDVDVRKAAQVVKDAGYDGFEPVMSEAGYLTPDMSDAQIEQIGRIAQDLGLEIPSVGVWSLWDNNLVSDREATRTKAKDIVRRQLDAAAILGADTILVVPGYVGCTFTEEPECIAYDVAYERAQEALTDLSRHAQSAGVCIGIENVWNKFLLSPLEMRRFVDEVGSDFVGVYFDVGNIIYIGYPEQWIDILGSRIRKVHLSDYRYGAAGLTGFVDLFAGDVDFAAVMRALERIGYDDYLTLEMLPNYVRQPFVSPAADKAAMDCICAMGKSGGTR